MPSHFPVMQSFDEVSAILRQAAVPLAAVRVPVGEGAGHVLAEDVTARLDAPRADVSAMDGYAVREADLPGPFRLVGTSAAGSAETLTLDAGEAARIFTGAPLPRHADRVLVQEIVSREGDVVRLVGDYGAERHIRERGTDFRAGEVLLRAGQAIDYRNLVLLAAADRGDVAVWRRPRVAILTTGDELSVPGTALGQPGTLPESVSPAIAALARAWGGTVIARGMARDDPAAIAALSAELLEKCDVLVLIGGASVGERDFAHAAITGGGFALLFGKAAIRPGKPIWAAANGRGQIVLGLPGNPTSAMVTARLFLAPLLTALGGGHYDAALEWFALPLAAPLPPAGPREHFARGTLGEGRAMPLTDQRSSAQATLARATLLIRQAAGSGAVPVGAEVQALRF